MQNVCQETAALQTAAQMTGCCLLADWTLGFLGCPIPVHPSGSQWAAVLAGKAVLQPSAFLLQVAIIVTRAAKEVIERP